MIARLFDVQNGVVIPTEHCYTLKALKDIMDNKTASDRDRISAAKEILKNTKSEILDKENYKPLIKDYIEYIERKTIE